MNGNESPRLDCRAKWTYFGLLWNKYYVPDESASDAPVRGAAAILEAILDAGGTDVSITYTQPGEYEGYARSNDPLPDSVFGIPVERTEPGKMTLDSVVFRFSLGVPADPGAAWRLARLVADPPDAPCLTEPGRRASGGNPQLELRLVPEFRPAMADVQMWRVPGDAIARDWEPGAAAALDSPPADSSSASGWGWRETFLRKAAATLCGGDPEAYAAFARIARRDEPELLWCRDWFDADVAAALKKRREEAEWRR